MTTTHVEDCTTTARSGSSRWAILQEQLALRGEQTAVVTASGEAITYTELAERAKEIQDRLGTARRLVAIAGTNTVEFLCSYIAALSGGHPAMIARCDAGLAQLVAKYDPDVVIRGAGAEMEFIERHAMSVHELHPDLALLLQTSGSTGSPKLVRLSYDNLKSNAESISQFLDVTARDRAALTLPMQYCYGLSVVNSHLMSGASVILSDDSVLDPSFWDRFRAFDATNFAGVPHTFELLDRNGFSDFELPSLRFVTQAGGRLKPEAVLRYSRLGQERGFDFFVMYGQTEATARMAYLPPELAVENPTAIGFAIPGGSFDIDRESGCLEGELLYRGPNVMMGYADCEADLSKGPTLEVLRTGDIARETSGGLIEIVGRHSRFAKLFGLRIDLDELEKVLHSKGITAICESNDVQILVATTSDADHAHVVEILQERLNLPRNRIAVFTCDEVPLLESSKTDLQAIRAMGTAECSLKDGFSDTHGEKNPCNIPELYAAVLDIDLPNDTESFVGLGGDSLSYVELSIALEDELGTLPANWHHLAIQDLPHAKKSRERRQRQTHMPIDIVLRAVATVLIVASHIEIINFQGGAHLLLAVSGYNFARFFLPAVDAPSMLRRTTRLARRIAIPTMVGIWVYFAVDRVFDGDRLLFIYNYTSGGRGWRYWYIEVLLQTLLVAAVVTSIPKFRKVERAQPFETACAVLGFGLALRFLAGNGLLSDSLVQTHNVFWLFALGWAIERCKIVRQRILVTAALLVAIPGFFDRPSRWVIVLIGVSVLIWARRIPLPSAVASIVGVIASSSLYIYVSHFEVYPPLREVLPSVVVVPITIAVGIGIDAGVRRARRTVKLRFQASSG